MKYKKYFRKTSLKQDSIGSKFLNEVATARNVCELLHSIHDQDFKYVGFDLFGENHENLKEIIPSTKFKNPLKNFYFKYILRKDPYSLEAVSDLLKKFKNNVQLIKGNSNNLLKESNFNKSTGLFTVVVSIVVSVQNFSTRSLQVSPPNV